MIDELTSEIISGSKLFIGLKPDEMNGILENTYETEYKAGDLIIKEGDPIKGLSIIIEGETSIQKKNNMTGKTIELKIRGVGESLGEMTLIDSDSRSVTVRAKSDVKVAVISLEYLASVFEEDQRIRADVAFNIAKILSKRLREATEYAASKTR